MCNTSAEAGAAMDAEVRALRAEVKRLTRERDGYRAERDTLAAQVKRAEAMMRLIDRHVGGADQTCDEPGISISEAARRTLRDQGHPLFQEDAANA